MILLSGAATDTDRTDDLSIALLWDIAGANHHAPTNWIREFRKNSHPILNGARDPSSEVPNATALTALLIENEDATDPGPIHARVRNKISVLIDHRNVYGLFDFNRLFRRSHNRKCFRQREHQDPFEKAQLQAAVHISHRSGEQHTVSDPRGERLYFDIQVSISPLALASGIFSRAFASLASTPVSLSPTAIGAPPRFCWSLRIELGFLLLFRDCRWLRSQYEHAVATLPGEPPRNSGWPPIH